MLDRELLTRAAAPFGVTVDAALFERFDIYARLLTEWNEKMNLTAITDPTDIAVKHFADSLTAAHLLPQGAFSLIDVGTGAGFPGVPLAMLRDDCALALLDSLNKRLVFLEALCAAVGVNAVRVHARAEDGGKNPALRENFDVATARAVSNLPVLCEYCLPFVRVGAFWRSRARRSRRSLPPRNAPLPPSAVSAARWRRVRCRRTRTASAAQDIWFSSTKSKKPRQHIPAPPQKSQKLRCKPISRPANSPNPARDILYSESRRK